MNRRVLIVIGIVSVAILGLVFRYDEKVYGNRKYRYDRFTKTVYLTGAYMKKPVWRKTRFVNIDQALQFEKRRELQEIVDEAENRREEKQSELEDRAAQLEDRQQEIEYDMQRKQQEAEQQQRDLEQKQRDLEYQMRRNR